MLRPSQIPPALLPPKDCPPNLQHCGYNRLPPSRIDHSSVPQSDTSKLSVIFYTLRKVAFKWPLWLQVAMTKAVVDGLPLGFPYGCAQGTTVAVDEGYTHIAADVSCTLVDLGLVSAVATAVAILVELQRADVAAAANFASLVGGNFEAIRDQALTMVDQGQFEHAVVVFYKALVLGVRSQRPDLIAMCTALVGAAGQRYREMLAETNGRLAKDRYSRELARVTLALMGQGHIGVAVKLSATMIRRGYLLETVRLFGSVAVEACRRVKHGRPDHEQEYVYSPLGFNELKVKRRKRRKGLLPLIVTVATVGTIILLKGR